MNYREMCRRIRDVNSWTQAEMARRMGCNERTIRRIENEEGYAEKISGSLKKLIEIWNKGVERFLKSVS